MNLVNQIEELNEEQFVRAVREASAIVLVEFSADWSGPCHIIMPILHDLAVKYSDKVEFYQFDVDKYPDTAKKFGIQPIPTILIFKNGEILDRVCGVVSKSDLDAKLRKLIPTQSGELE